MAFTVEDFQDLLTLLREHPDWRQQLWALLAGEELLRLPAEVKAFREETQQHFRRVARQIAALVKAQRRHYEEFIAFRAEADRRFLALQEEIAAARAEADRRFAELAEAQRRTEENLGRLSEAFAAHRQEFLEHRAETDRRFAELAEAQRRTEENLGRLSEAFAAHRQEFLEHRAETDRRFAELAEAQRRHYEEFIAFRAEADRRFLALQEEIAAARAEADRRFAELAQAIHRLTGRLEDHARDLSDLKRMRLEALYREEVSFFRRLLRRASPISGERKGRILDEAVEAGRITEQEADQAAPLDLLVEGFHRREDRRLYLAVEISWLGDTEDVRRARERATIFARALEAEVWPVVAAKALTSPARALARRLGVWWIQDGQAFAPHEIPEPSFGEPSAEG
ncbi:hypothetical protein HRbin22_01792 [Candidatus Thermoflexus japonica]|uniref:Uncharacterized protein n=1 Tax=Candidatus Thermoflexus japonica TaxID=2035417 RepID=A0A2H5Y7W6_9CHLR|nr:hypothetical protein HRbin22_01792 [Candidatus Thermoflexus japonica]